MTIALILLLIMLNGVFAMTEAALISSRRARLEAMSARGSRGALRALALTDNPTRFLSTVQVGITLIGIGAGALGEKSIADQIEPLVRDLPLIGRYSGTTSSIIMVVILTYFSLILGELVPKRLALANPEGVSSVMAAPMNLIARLVRPLVALLSTSTDLLVRLFPARASASEAHAEAEVKALLASGAQQGVFHESEQRIVERVFRLSDQTARSLMVPRTEIDWLRADDPVGRVRVAVATSSHSHFPVCKGQGGLDDLIGVVHVKDLVKSGLITDDVNVGQIARPPMFVPENTPALELLERFRQSREHIVFVADEHGTLEGLVTLNDVVTAIIGEVSRHDDDDDPMVVRRSESSFLLDGLLGVDELRRVMGLNDDDELPKQEEGYETLGGLVMTFLGRIPATGDVFTWNRYRFEVVDMDRKRVDKVMLTIEPAGGEDPFAAAK
ncbi:MAG: HlyC/CorC family transporter [Phycisphaeraceae bacterium]|nr:HlyC/CorC family transporter [Phycisphaeraceae bacterium]